MRWRGASSSLPPSILLFIQRLSPYIAGPPPFPLPIDFFYAVKGGSASVPPSLKDQTLLSSITHLAPLSFFAFFMRLRGAGSSLPPSILLFIDGLSPFIAGPPPFPLPNSH